MVGQKPEWNTLFGKLRLKQSIMLKCIGKTRSFKIGFIYFGREVRGQLLWEIGNKKSI